MIEVKTENGKCSCEMRGTGITLLADAGVIVHAMRNWFKKHDMHELFDMMLRDDDSPVYNDGILKKDEHEQEPEDKDPSTEDEIKQLIDLLKNL